MKSMVGLKIKSIRYMTENEMAQEGWNKPTVVIVLEDGTLIYPSSDTEGNRAGVLFGKKGKLDFYILPS